MKDIPVVGIGASAGGLDALEQFFENMPKNSGMAFIVIQHLDPDRDSIMPELLQKTTEMKVVQVSNNVQVEGNHVYVTPPNKNISVSKGSLHLSDPLKLQRLQLPIDYFFRSLAEDRRDKSIGVILSGMGSDGSLGVQAIKEKNGTVLVQDPTIAKYDSMPQSAVNSVVVDIQGAANELPEKLIAFLKHDRAIVQKIVIDDNGNPGLEQIVALVQSQIGHDFSMYKKNTLLRRIERRMNVHLIENIENYVRFLQENPNELDILFKEFLIGVTNFFRDKAVWKKLKEKVLPDMFNKLPDGHILRAWVTGCSTGEEAYSLAIVFKEACEKADKNISLQIFATDIDGDAIEKARKASFSQNIVADVSPERIKKFFTKTETDFSIKTTLREMIVFAPHDVTKDPPFNKIDLIFCRNLFIYLEHELQRKLINLFHYTLNPDGVLVLGNAESLYSKSDQFRVIDSKLKFYKRKEDSVNSVLSNFPSSFSHTVHQESDKNKPIKITENIQSLTDKLMLERFAPAAVLINTEGDILYISGKTGKYLELATGKASMNIFAMARERLNHLLPGAIRKVRQNHGTLKLRKVQIGTNGGAQMVDITLQFIEKPTAIKGTIIIVFNDVTEITETLKTKTKSENPNSTERELALELELKYANEEQQNISEEMQRSQEELKSANEEMQATNEELQASNEELTASKEEMQSLNEELQTVNAELQSKLSDFTDVNNDMKNLLNSTEIATLFLDKELNIRRFTHQLTKLFRLREADIGRPFTDLVSKLSYPKMTDDANEVLRSLAFKEIAVSTKNEEWFTVRLMPYRTNDDRIDGLVITFIEITEKKRLETELKNAITILQKHKLYKA